MSSRLDVHVGAAMFSKALTVVSWIAPLSLLMWAVRIDVLEGYIYEVPRNFAGDFTAVSSLQVPEWWDGRGMFYGPIFVLEARYLVIPHVLSRADFARADFLLFGLAFMFVWAALIGRRHPRLTLWLLAAWLAHQATVQAFANTAHLEVLELALLGAALLFAVRGQRPHAGGLLGLATATKTLPVLFIPYLAIRREWSMLAWACFAGGSVFLVACWVLAIAPWEGLAGLAYQRGNLTGLEFTSYHYALRSDFARVLAQGRETLAPDQVSLAVALHWMVTVAAILFGVWAIARSRAAQPRYGLIFGLVLAL
ncbi:MAG: DUF2029 domain-containing protein, partial [Chloroflexi bacterium]|nr:DUF2029 domain-containing protein [Chloroflexota bacterium]